MNSEDNWLPVGKTLELINNLIETKQGDPGRLKYIFESLQKGKPLFKTDQKYLEKKIHAKTIVEPPKPPSKLEENLKKQWVCFYSTTKGVAPRSRMLVAAAGLEPARPLPSGRF